MPATAQAVCDLLAEETATLLLRRQEKPWGNYPKGRTLEEYHLEDGGYLQVAWNNLISSDTERRHRLDDWCTTDTRLAFWGV